MIRVVIIEDEKHAAEELLYLLENGQQKIQVIAVLESVQSGTDFFASNNSSVDLIFSDIQLTDGLSFDILTQIPHIPVIFTTAYNEYTLQAFDTHSIHYLLKPLSQEDIDKSLEKFEKFSQKEDKSNIDALLKHFTKQQPRSILLQQKEALIPVKTEDIRVAYLDTGIIWILDKDENRYSWEDNLEDLEQKLGNSFFRINRQCIAHKEAIVKIQPYLGGKLILDLFPKPPFKVMVSKPKKREFLVWMES